MRKARCYLCNMNQSNILYTFTSWKIVRCHKCGFIFVDPKPSALFLKKYYSKFSLNIFEKNTITLNDSKRTLKLLDKYRDDKRTLLDIGCGNGTFMLEAKRHSWVTVGIDTSSTLVNYITQNTDLLVYKSSISAYTSGDKYDLITMNQVIEHFADPISVIRKCKKLLNQSGLLYISTPNIDSYVAKIRKIEFDYIMPPEHLSYFNKASLANLLMGEHFKILYMGSWSYPVDLVGLVKFVIGKRKKLARSKISMPNRNYIKIFKYIIFDKLFCSLFYKFLNTNLGGTNLEIIAQKL